MKAKVLILGASALAALALVGSAKATTDLVQNGSFTAYGAPGSTYTHVTSNGDANLADGETYITGWYVGTGQAQQVEQVWLYPSGHADETPGWPDGLDSDWPVKGPNVGYNNNLGPSPAGGGVAVLDGGADYRASLNQDISGLTSGQTYELSFYWSAGQQLCCGGTTTEQVDVTFGSTTWESPVWTNPYNGFSGWFKVTIPVVANATTDTLSFLAVGTPNGEPPMVLLSDVSLPAPEPAAWAMIIAGMGALGAVSRRRRAAALTA